MTGSRPILKAVAVALGAVAGLCMLGVVLFTTTRPATTPPTRPTSTSATPNTPMDRYRAAVAQHYGPGIDVDKATAAGVHLCDLLSGLPEADRQTVTDQVHAAAPPQAGYAIDAAAGTLCPVERPH